MSSRVLRTRTSRLGQFYSPAMAVMLLPFSIKVLRLSNLVLGISVSRLFSTLQCIYPLLIVLDFDC